MARKHNEPLPSDPRELDGVSKAAILLLAVGPDNATQVLKHLPADKVEEVTRELAGLGRVNDTLQNAVIEEFCNISIATQYANEGSLSYAKQLLQNSLEAGLAERVLGQIQTQVQKTPSRRDAGDDLGQRAARFTGQDELFPLDKSAIADGFVNERRPAGVRIKTEFFERLGHRVGLALALHRRGRKADENIGTGVDQFVKHRTGPDCTLGSALR